MSKDQEKNAKENDVSEKETEFPNRVEGKKALEHLYEKLDDEGLLDDPEQETLVKKLLNRIDVLEHEVSTLKDLFARALKVDNVKVLKD